MNSLLDIAVIPCYFIFFYLLLIVSTRAFCRPRANLCWYPSYSKGPWSFQMKSTKSDSRWIWHDTRELDEVPPISVLSLAMSTRVIRAYFYFTDPIIIPVFLLDLLIIPKIRHQRHQSLHWCWSNRSTSTQLPTSKNGGVIGKSGRSVAGGMQVTSTREHAGRVATRVHHPAHPSHPQINIDGSFSGKSPRKSEKINPTRDFVPGLGVVSNSQFWVKSILF